MALSTRHLRNGQPLTYKWGWFHLTNLLNAVEEEIGEQNPMPNHYVYTDEHCYTDPNDGEIMVIIPGDEMELWR